ncbi:hypothetical protein SK224_07295 [Microbacterium sp. BG28]|uniref:hypothetical protein n=1 Tax=Microbacterium sp. BG28 TaxID=3097356 RepID=UPI002A5A4001|nr:hypothetical protein [Microbacterium sp. BG28]MDY0828930.1 hypothetical protein [Microbacterium sp. BG28]
MRLFSPVAAAAVLVAAFGLTACTAPASSTTATPSLTSTASADPTLVVGAVVDATTAQEIGTRGTQRAYPMADGSFIVVDRGEPLPAAVQADIDAKAVAFSEEWGSDAQAAATSASLRAREKVIADASWGTGKRPILILKMTAYETAEAEAPTTFWMVNGAGPAPDGVSRSREEMTAVVNDWLAQQDDPDLYVVIHG